MESREIHAGGSLAGKDSIDASSTMSISCSGLSLGLDPLAAPIALNPAPAPDVGAQP